MPQSTVGIQRRDEVHLWAIERVSRQRTLSNWPLDGLNYFEWGEDAFEDMGSESKAES